MGLEAAVAARTCPVDNLIFLPPTLLPKVFTGSHSFSRQMGGGSPTSHTAMRFQTRPLVFFLLKSLQCFSSNTLWHVDVSASHCNCGKHLRGRLILVPCDLCVASQKTQMHQEKGFLMFCFANSLAVNCTHRTRHSFASLNVAESAKRSTVCSVDVD